MRGLSLGLGMGPIPPSETGGEGPELWPQPTFDATTGLTLGNWTHDVDAVVGAADQTFCSATALGTLTAGTYRIVVEITDNPQGTGLVVQIGGTSAGSLGGGQTGVFTVDAPIASVSTQVIRFRDGVGDGGLRITAFSVKLLS